MIVDDQHCPAHLAILWQRPARITSVPPLRRPFAQAAAFNIIAIRDTAAELSHG